MLNWSRHARRSLGIYVGLDDVTVVDPFSGKSHVAEFGNGSEGLSIGNALESAYSALGRPASELQVAFCNALLRFTTWHSGKRPKNAEEAKRLARWRMAKMLPDADAYEFSYQVLTEPDGYTLLFVAAPRWILDELRTFCSDKRLRWTVADSAASYVFNDLKPELKSDAGALLMYSAREWSFLCWKSGGIVSLVKPGTSPDNRAMSLDDAVTEARRLLNLMAATGDEVPTRVWVWGEELESLVSEQSESEILFERISHPLSNGEANEKESLEQTIATLASYTR